MNKTLVTLGLAATLAAPMLANADPVPDFTKLVKQTSPAVVSVEVMSKVDTTPMRGRSSEQLPPGLPEFFQQFFGDQFQNQAYQQPSQNAGKEVEAAEGSGFIISEDGYILTNAHVVSDADSVNVQLNDRQQYKAKIVGVDKNTDIALLKIKGDDFPVVKMGDSDKVQVGDWVLAIGSPFGFATTATKGIVSALGRSLPNGTYTPFIQTDAAINPGNSGGPLFNSEGEVIGINSQIYTRSGAFNGIGFAIPINVAKNIAKQLKDSGKVTRGWLGVEIQGIDQKLAESFGMKRPQGALVARVMKDSPAEKAGLKQGDVILTFNDKEIGKSADLPPLVALSPIDEKATLGILRDGKHETVEVTIGNLNDAEKHGLISGMNSWGMLLAPLDKKTREALQFDGKTGVLISKVKPGSPADNSGLQAGDVLLAVGGKSVNSPQEAKTLLGTADSSRPLPLLVYRDGVTTFLALVPEQK